MTTDKDSLVALLERSKHEFYGLMPQHGEYFTTLQPEHEKHINAAKSAGIILMTLSTERLRELEMKKVIHTSTIAGSSLASALFAIKMYDLGERSFERDYIEQLARTCYSAARVIKLDIR